MNLLLAAAILVLTNTDASVESYRQRKPGKTTYALAYKSSAGLLRVGPSFLSKSTRLGGIAQFVVGPSMPFMEVLLASRGSSYNIGNNFQLSLRTDRSRVFGGFGIGLSGTVDSDDDTHRLRPLVQGMAGLDLKLTDRFGAFAQVQYLHTFDDRDFAVKGISLQAGLAQGF